MTEETKSLLADLMRGKYILNDKREPVPCADLETWGKQYVIDKRRVDFTVVADGVEVSTVFLGYDHSFGGGQPVLFETLVFGGPLDMEMERYYTWDEAVAGHAEMVARVKSAQQ